jgi:hypothetical protein
MVQDPMKTGRRRRIVWRSIEDMGASGSKFKRSPQGNGVPLAGAVFGFRYTFNTYE